jgi:hypothetical protein
MLTLIWYLTNGSTVKILQMLFFTITHCVTPTQVSPSHGRAGLLTPAFGSTAGRRMRRGGGEPAFLAESPVPLGMCRPCIILTLNSDNNN